MKYTVVGAFSTLNVAFSVWVTDWAAGDKDSAARGQSRVEGGGDEEARRGQAVPAAGERTASVTVGRLVRRKGPQAGAASMVAADRLMREMGVTRETGPATGGGASW